MPLTLYRDLKHLILLSYGCDRSRQNLFWNAYSASSHRDIFNYLLKVRKDLPVQTWQSSLIGKKGSYNELKCLIYQGLGLKHLGQILESHHQAETVNWPISIPAYCKLSEVVCSRLQTDLEGFVARIFHKSSCIRHASLDLVDCLMTFHKSTSLRPSGRQHRNALWRLCLSLSMQMPCQWRNEYVTLQVCTQSLSLRSAKEHISQLMTTCNEHKDKIMRLCTARQIEPMCFYCWQRSLRSLV